MVHVDPQVTRLCLLTMLNLKAVSSEALAIGKSATQQKKHKHKLTFGIERPHQQHMKTEEKEVDF